jgi:hypothetical protein
MRSPTDSSSPTFLRSDHSLLAHQHRVRPPRTADVFSLVANHRCDTRFEIFGALDCSLQRLCWVERELCTIALRAASTETRR